MENLKNPIEALKNWIPTLDKDWLKQVVTEVLDKKKMLKDDELNPVFKSFLIENQLAQREDTDIAQDDIESEKKENKNLKKEEETLINKMIIESITGIEGVNALMPNQEIKFNLNLTVIYGHNAVGKTGYVRVLKRASNSRTSEDIWGDIHKRKVKNQCKARFKLCINDKQVEINWQGEKELYPFTLIDVFDNKCVKVYLTNKVEFGFKPYGFDLFSIISDCINSIKEKLASEINQKNNIKDFSPFFNKDTKVGKLINSLSYQTNREVLDELVQFGVEDSCNLIKKEKEKKDLEYSDDRIKVLRIEKTTIENIKSIIRSINEELTYEKISEYKTLVTNYCSARREAEQKQTSSLSSFDIPSKETKEWKEFIKSAEEYIKLLSNHEHYPAEEDKCIYCRQILSKNARELIKSYRDLLKSNEVNNFAQIERKINDKVTMINQQKFSFPNYPTETIEVVKTLLNNIKSELYQEIKNYCEKANALRDKILTSLNKKELLALDFNIDNEILNNLEDSLKNKQQEINRLEEGEKRGAENLKQVTHEINELADKKILSDKKKEILEYLDNLIWIKKAQDIQRLLTTKPVTDLSKKVWDQIVTDAFKQKFEIERELLSAPRVDFSFPGEYGTAKRSKTIEGMENIDDFLSEGEQKAIALADFLAELSLKQEITPVVFDDPVTSFDHLRRDIIAKRLVEESKKRQVIVFTHDILFLHYLYRYCGEDISCSFFHWVEKDISGLHGKISLNDCPMLDDFNFKIQKVEKCLTDSKELSGSAKQDKIMEGFSHLRAAYENYVIEKIFKNVVKRYEERVQMLSLDKIKFNSELLITIKKKFEELSRFIEAHSHSDVSQEKQPTTEDLEKELNYLKNLKTQ